MKSQLSYLSFEVQVSEGQKLDIPESIKQKLGEGKWLVKIQPSNSIRSQEAFLNGYAPEDEGLYDDY